MLLPNEILEHVVPRFRHIVRTRPPRKCGSVLIPDLRREQGTGATGRPAPLRAIDIRCVKVIQNLFGLFWTIALEMSQALFGIADRQKSQCVYHSHELRKLCLLLVEVYKAFGLDLPMGVGRDSSFFA